MVSIIIRTSITIESGLDQQSNSSSEVRARGEGGGVGTCVSVRQIERDLKGAKQMIKIMKLNNFIHNLFVFFKNGQKFNSLSTGAKYHTYAPLPFMWITTYYNYNQCYAKGHFPSNFKIAKNVFASQIGIVG